MIGDSTDKMTSPTSTFTDVTSTFVEVTSTYGNPTLTYSYAASTPKVPVPIFFTAENTPFATPGEVKTIGVRGTGPGCGKDTVADYIAELLKQKNIQAYRSAFANGVREDVSKITDIPVEVIRTTEGKNMVFESLGVTVGKLLQYHGQAKKKLHGDDVWIRYCMDSLPTEDKHVSIISDVRYKGEQTAVQKRGGIIIMVKSDRPTSAILMAGRSLQHSSERDLDGVSANVTIENNGTLEELKQKVKALVDSLFP